MAFLIGGANSAADTGFDVANSCRFNDGDSAYLNKTNGTPTNSKKCTLSMWFKRCELSDANNFLFGNWTGTSQYAYLRLQADDTLFYSAVVDSGTSAQLVTTQVFRDVSAWYHVVLALDTEQGTAANRAKLYINGTQVTSFSTETYPAEDATTQFTENLSSGGFQIGSDKDTGSRFYDGYMAEVVVIDGTQYAASDFGEFDEDSPTIWKPKDVSGLTFGNNGAYLDFEDSDNLGDDESGNTNDWTENNLAAADQATDTPTNSFATLNSLEYSGGGKTFSEGNCKMVMTGVANFTRSTIGAANGKWYCEVKLIAGVRAMYGISSYESNAASNYLGELGSTTVGYGYGIKGNDGRLYHAGGSTANWVDAVSADDIVMIAMDLDNYKLYFGNGGTWERSGDPTSGATGTGAYTIVAPSLNGTGFYHFAFGGNDVNYDYNSEINFGGCSAFTVSSANQDGNGYGNFEYAVPSGYLSLCTKNLGSDGG